MILTLKQCYAIVKKQQVHETIRTMPKKLWKKQPF